MKYFKLKYLIPALLIGFLALCFAGWQYWRVRDFVYEKVFAPSGPTIQTKAQIDEVLTSFEKISFSQLPGAYLKQTRSDQAPFNKMLRGKSYYKLQQEDIYRKIVGNFRIKSFMAKDQAYKAHIMSWGNSEGLYWLVDKRLLYKFIELQQKLKKAGHNPHGFLVVNGYRPPKYNKAIGGASKSRHIVGEAVDILVKDVNKDGKVTQADKTIILNLLDQEVIGIMGGIGRYPKTMSVHFDVRGYKARWDSY